MAPNKEEAEWKGNTGNDFSLRHSYCNRFRMVSHFIANIFRRRITQVAPLKVLLRTVVTYVSLVLFVYRGERVTKQVIKKDSLHKCEMCI